MKNKTVLTIAIFAISLLIIPQMTFASWWKPNTWKIFNKKAEVKIEQKIIATSTLNNVISQTEKATTTPMLSRSSGQSVGAEKIEQKSEEAKKNDQSKEIEKLKKEVEALKQKQSQFKIIEKITEKPIIAEKKESSSSQTKQNENIVTLPNGSVVEMDTNGNISRTIKEAPQQIYTPVQTSNLNKESSKFITIKELDGSYQQKNRIADLYFSIYNNSDTEAHVNLVNMQLFGYGFLPDTEAIAYLQDNTGQTLGFTPLQHSSKSATSSITIQLDINLSQPLVIYEKSQKNFRITITFKTMTGSEINAAKLLGVGFSGVSANNFTAQGLPVMIYTKKVEIGGAPEKF